MTPKLTREQAQRSVAETEAELAAAFARRQCWCGAPAVSVAPGASPVWHNDLLLSRGARERGYCLCHLGISRADAG